MSKSTISRKVIKRANAKGMPDKMRDKIYMLYAMAMIAEGLCIDTKQMEAYELCCKLRERVKGATEHGELSDNLYEFYKSLGYADITLLPHLLYLISDESKKLKATMLAHSPVSNYIDESETRQIEKIALKSFLNFEIVKKIRQMNIDILNNVLYNI